MALGAQLGLFHAAWKTPLFGSETKKKKYEKEGAEKKQKISFSLLARGEISCWEETGGREAKNS